MYEVLKRFRKFSFVLIVPIISSNITYSGMLKICSRAASALSCLLPRWNGLKQKERSKKSPLA